MTLDLILSIIGAATQTIQTVTKPGAAQDAVKLAAALAGIAQAANAAHQEVAGQPIDLDKIQALPLVE